MLLASGMAGMDGLVVGKYVGHGEWNHWGYGSALAVQGLVMLGLLDGLFGSGVKVSVLLAQMGHEAKWWLMN